MNKFKSLFLILVFSSCSTYVPATKTVGSSSDEVKPQIVYRDVIKREVSSIKDPSFDFKDDLDLEYQNKHFKFWIKYFSKREKSRFLRHAKNGAKYRSVIKKIFKSHGLPEDLFFVGLIESGYNTYIRSRAAAVGPWQFIKGTATRYGLRVDGYTDERSHIIKSTEAAASYFKDLYNIFGSWELALCAYNAGEYRIINAIRKGNTRDYQKLVALKLIPKETIFYIPKVAAARTLYQNPSKYGLQLPKVETSIFERVKPVKIRKSFDFYKLAKKENVSVKTFKILNPDIKKRWVRVSKYRKQQIFLPSSSSTNFSRLAESSFPQQATRAISSKRAHKTYSVKKGDNLTSIARRLSIKLSDLKRINKIKGSRIFVGQKLKIKQMDIAKSRIHRVKSGENLTLIANRYGLTTSNLKIINGLSSSRIRIGQRLKISGSTLAMYKVRRGDSLSGIASKFGVRQSQIKSKNNMNSSKIFYAQILKIPNKG